MPQKEAKEEWKYDADYIRYVESGESAAVFVVRDIAISIPTKGKWTDIISMSPYWQDKDGRAFNWIVAELFPRKIRPDYSECKTDEEKKYLTWKTAHEDISQQRKEGYSGPKYLILCTLHDKNKGKFKKFTLTGIFKRYRSEDGEIRDIQQEEGMPDKPETINLPLPHKWEYKITYLKKLNNEQAEYIESHEAELKAKIDAEGKSSPEIFGFKSSKKKESRK